MKKKCIILITITLFLANIQAQNIQPLITTHWGQRAPYNSLCPLDSSGYHMPAGCGPVAMAQTLNFLKIRKDSIQLICDCGIVAKTKYSKIGSTTDIYNITNSMKQVFRVSRYTNIVYQRDYVGKQGEEDWKELLFNELRNGRVIISAGNGDNPKGHIFILDGIKGDLIHANFGWKGSHDGFYPVSRIYKYLKKMEAIIDIGDSNYIPHSDTIKTIQAGTLQTIMIPHYLGSTRHLKINGPLNDGDIKWLHSLCEYNEKLQNYPHLSTLDLRDAQIASLPDYAFANSNRLSYIVLPKKLEAIGKFAFKNCSNLNYIDLPESINEIGIEAFRYCRNLMNIDIPLNVNNIGYDAFSDCDKLSLKINSENKKFFIKNNIVFYIRTQKPVERPITKRCNVRVLRINNKWNIKILK